MSITAKIHSIETCGTVDGPGIRYVIFFKGCPLRCVYCHNPDTWNGSEYKEVSVSEVFSDILKYKEFMAFSQGGVTVTGGEPLLQTEFIYELFKLCKKENIHTAIDTSGNIFDENVKKVLEFTDLVLLDIKAFDDDLFKSITGKSVRNTLLFAEWLNQKNIATWIRFVFVPTVNDDFDDIEKIADYIKRFDNIKRVEVLPFHKMGEYKWEELNLEYKLKEVEVPAKESIEKVKAIFIRNGIDVVS